jgi:hypothetical protein
MMDERVGVFVLRDIEHQFLLCVSGEMFLQMARARDCDVLRDGRKKAGHKARLF